MTGVDSREFMPILSVGRHRNPRKGACFMEMASYLAGEPWTDDPACTHPLLSSLARLVNDNTSDRARSALAVLVPEVIGLNGDGLRWYALIARTAAIAALSESPAERQNALAVGLLTTERMLAQLDGRPRDSLSQPTREALERTPLAARWASRFWVGAKPGPGAYVRRSAPAIVRFSVHGILSSTAPDPDARLRALLVAEINVCKTLLTDATHLEESRVNLGRSLRAIP
ncbi:hypothetical protein JOE57_000277 [Microlunatus panaciterrae]|uniref:Uncharacterized protein n=1 Tax=Microlunatus panaciterrae TaxID=400768 RepID=A0ABS2RGN6_9ACTN|nr:hypothetical protein [Microlunatus panaciterrae]MBM7797356.1 hypothetical protein [Microlunatus panaciterrae]